MKLIYYKDNICGIPSEYGNVYLSNQGQKKYYK